MKIGILGSGNVGKALAKGFIAEGYDVMIGTRDPAAAKSKELKELGAQVGSFADTAQFAEIAVLCTQGTGTQNALNLAKSENLAGKVVIDVTNPLDLSSDKPQLSLGLNNSGGEEVQRWLPDSLVVKAFNSVGSALMYQPSYEHGEPTMFICGNNDEAKQSVRDILHLFGWDVVDMGDISSSRELESLCMLWVKYGQLNGTWNHAFKLLTH